MDDGIRELFRVRDEAVRKRDPEQFLSTQLVDVPFAASESYLSIDDMTTEVLHAQEESDGATAVFVRETYVSSKKEQKSPRSAFLIYFLVNTGGKWKVYRVR
ncbi:hypothetical protein MOQ72_29475 [Saccharopolyspora sp. K220]|uniref:hypothetical protein n=1 Tax=Saccharopolyspora soli TaxID=2926618 RepID=UPI001F5A6C5A|nr:hypothetical protein [Saccharopolyspora soli]MCI2421571.1 hypothetical protein [Saccharopolyspora soli]